jgi:hypothetical protein
MSKRIWWIALVCFVMISLIGVQMSWAEAPQIFRGQKSKATKINFRDMELEIPADSDEVEMTVQNSDVDLTKIRKPRNFVMVGKPYRFGPHGKKFMKNSELNIKLQLDSKIKISAHWKKYIRYYIDRDNKSRIDVPNARKSEKRITKINKRITAEFKSANNRIRNLETEREIKRRTIDQLKEDKRQLNLPYVSK